MEFVIAQQSPSPGLRHLALHHNHMSVQLRPLSKENSFERGIDYGRDLRVATLLDLKQFQPLFQKKHANLTLSSRLAATSDSRE
jgi:hypothetical protein